MSDTGRCQWSAFEVRRAIRRGGLSFELLKTVLVELSRHAVTLATVAAAS
jgi:hypothetical protein